MEDRTSDLAQRPNSLKRDREPDDTGPDPKNAKLLTREEMLEIANHWSTAPQSDVTKAKLTLGIQDLPIRPAKNQEGMAKFEVGVNDTPPHPEQSAAFAAGMHLAAQLRFTPEMSPRVTSWVVFRGSLVIAEFQTDRVNYKAELKIRPAGYKCQVWCWPTVDVVQAEQQDGVPFRK